MDSTYEVIVIGAGAVGSAAAWALAGAGREVLVLEKFALGHDRGGSHGASRLFRLDLRHGYLPLARRASELWAEIEAVSGQDLLTRTGGVEHGLTPAEAGQVGEAYRMSGLDHERLTPAEAERRWDGMRFEGEVVYQPDSGRLHADRSVATLQALAVRNGAEFRAQTPARRLRIHDADTHDAQPQGLVRVETDGDTFAARHVVVAAGAWAEILLEGVWDLPHITITQEQPRHFVPRVDAHDWPVFVHWRGRVPDGAGRGGAAGEAYGVNEPGLGVKVGMHTAGPVVDPDARDFTPEPTADAELLAYVRDWLPGLDAGQSVPISCLYDNSPDGDFVIDRRGPVTVATGFCGQGFKFVPALGELLRDLVAGSAHAAPRFRIEGRPMAGKPRGLMMPGGTAPGTKAVERPGGRH